MIGHPAFLFPTVLTPIAALNRIAFMRVMIKVWLAVTILLAGMAAPSMAATFSAKRGMNLDIWITWPSEKDWGDRDSILPFPEWRKFLKPADLETLKAAGFDFVRMPVDPAPLLSDRSAPLAADLLASILDSVRMVNAAGLKVVVDMHAIPAGGGRAVGTSEILADPLLFVRYTDTLRKVAHMLANEDPSLVALELMNEPTSTCEGKEAKVWAGQLSKLVAAARASAPRLTLILSGACWSSADGLASLDPADFPDDNLLWAFHSYDPFLLTHQGATWAGDFIQYVTGIPYPPSLLTPTDLANTVAKVKAVIDAEAPWSRRQGMKAYLDEQIALIDAAEKLAVAIEKPFATVDEWSSKHGIEPEDILLGEFGMIRQEWGSEFIMPAPERAAYYRDIIFRAEKHGYAWSMWSYGGAFGVVDAFDGHKAEPDVLDMVRGLR